jgi:hypothetical protein
MSATDVPRYTNSGRSPARVIELPLGIRALVILLVT